MWKPISINELLDIISETENDLEAELSKFWKLVKISPEKWQEEQYGKDGGGFWVVGIYGKNVIWYNDIEEGFNVSKYDIYGVINNCAFEQYELNQIVYQLYNSLLFIR